MTLSQVYHGILQMQEKSACFFNRRIKIRL